MSEQHWQLWFEKIWALREETLYRSFFGDTGPGIYTLPASTFASLGEPNPDPRFLTHGVFECPPNPTRDHWLYVTSGMSNPWGDTPETANPEGYSGLGYEFTVHARERGRWPILLLHWLMAVQLLVAAGKLQGELLQRNDRIPLGGPLAKKDGLLTHALVTAPDEVGLSDNQPFENQPTYPPVFALPSGHVDLLLLIGITENEKNFAQSQSVEGLITLLRHHHVFPFTDPTRISMV